MRQGEVYFQDGVLRVRLSKIYPAIRTARAKRLRYQPELLTQEERASGECPWEGHAVAKGVTHVGRLITNFGFLDEIVLGYHYRLAEGFPGIELDPQPRCYEDWHLECGFGGFTRWVYFVNPAGTDDYVGLDFSLGPPPQSGVATTVLRAKLVFSILAELGLPLSTQTALLNPYQLWPDEVANWQRRVGLMSLADWIERAPQLLYPVGPHCLRCGQPSFTDHRYRFCRSCGSDQGTVKRTTMEVLQCPTTCTATHGL